MDQVGAEGQKVGLWFSGDQGLEDTCFAVLILQVIFPTDHTLHFRGNYSNQEHFRHTFGARECCFKTDLNLRLNPSKLQGCLFVRLLGLCLLFPHVFKTRDVMHVEGFWKCLKSCLTESDSCLIKAIWQVLSFLFLLLDKYLTLHSGTKCWSLTWRQWTNLTANLDPVSSLHCHNIYC